MKTQNPVHGINILLMVCTVVCLVCYDILGGLWLKGLTSAWFVALGVVNLVYGIHRGIRHRFLWLTALGLAFGMAAVSLYLVTGTPFIRIEDPVLKPMLLGYAVIIACMLGKALSNLSVNRAPSRWLIALGSILFWFSDLMLAVDMFGTPSRLTWILCSYNYWPAQAILAYAMFRFVEEQGKET